MLVCVFFAAHLHARPRVQRAPGLPCALFLEARSTFANLGHMMSRERRRIFSRRPGLRAGTPARARCARRYAVLSMFMQSACSLVGWAKRSVPTSRTRATRWWARREHRFAHPTIFITTNARDYGCRLKAGTTRGRHRAASWDDEERACRLQTKNAAG